MRCKGSKTPESEKTIYVKRSLQVNLPLEENSHCMKNPFFKPLSVLCVTPRMLCRPLPSEDGTDSIADEADGSSKATRGGSQKEVRNITWMLCQVPKPEQEESDAGTLSFDPSEDLKDRPSDSISLDKCSSISVEGGLECWPSTFDEEIIQMKATMEYPKRISRDIASYFDIIRSLPLVTEEEIAQKRVNLPTAALRSNDKTLFVNLDYTLIHVTTHPPNLGDNQSQQWKVISYLSVLTDTVKTKYVKMRPGAEAFLRELHENYEIVVFTSAEKAYAQEIITKVLDPSAKFIDHVLTREHCLKANKYFIKDLRVISNREARNMVIVDHSLVSFSAQLNNGICVSSYEGGDNDTTLYSVSAFLKCIAGVPDVRKEIRRAYMTSDFYRVFLREKTLVESKGTQ